MPKKQQLTSILPDQVHHISLSWYSVFMTNTVLARFNLSIQMKKLAYYDAHDVTTLATHPPFMLIQVNTTVATICNLVNRILLNILQSFFYK